MHQMPSPAPLPSPQLGLVAWWLGGLAPMVVQVWRTPAAHGHRQNTTLGDAPTLTSLAALGPRRHRNLEPAQKTI